MLISIFIFNSFFSFSQCKEETRDDIWPDYIYIGCLDFEGNPSGKGKLIYKTDNKIYYEGNFKGFLFHGEGTLYLNNGIYSGVFEEDELVSGNMISENEGEVKKYEGGFRQDQRLILRHGEGIYTYENKNEPPENTIIEKLKEESGKFHNGTLDEGIRKVEWSNGEIITSTIKYNAETRMSEVVSEIRNDRNYYNPDDIDGDKEFTLINLDKRGDENDGISYFIPMNVSGSGSGVSSTIEGEWVFDTGAESFSIGRRMYEFMKEKGMQFKKLNMEVQSVGVGGISNGELIIIDEITIGDYKVKDVVTKVNLDHDYSLLGMWFLIKFSDADWSMKNNTLKLYK